MAGVSEWKPGTLVLYHDGELLCRHYSVLEVRPAAVPEGTSKRRNRLEPATLLPEPAGKRRKAQDPSPKCEGAHLCRTWAYRSCKSSAGSGASPPVPAEPF